MKLVQGRVENIVGKGENAGYQHFLLLPQCFQKASFSGLLKVGFVWQGVKPFRIFIEKSQPSICNHMRCSYLFHVGKTKRSSDVTEKHESMTTTTDDDEEEDQIRRRIKSFRKGAGMLNLFCQTNILDYYIL